MITDDGTAGLRDSGIIGCVTDPTVVESDPMETCWPYPARYMAPELLDPPLFSLLNSNPSKESDVYSFAMTAYEVRSFHTVHGHRLYHQLYNKTLTGIIPYGDVRDWSINSRIVIGDRPPRPPNARWLKDQIWNMIMTCWSGKREQRWDIRTVYNQLSVSSIQEIAETERSNRRTFSTNVID